MRVSFRFYRLTPFPDTVSAVSAQGPQGSAGEVSQQQLNSAIMDTPHNPTSVQTLSVGTTDPTLQVIIDKLNELISALRREP